MDVFFERTDAHTFRATEHTSGAWNPSEQHISPALGLITHILERDAAARGRTDLQLSRLSCDIFGVVPVAEFAYSTRLVRPGRTIELVEATLTSGERTIVCARAWFTAAANTGALAASPFRPLTPLEHMHRWDCSSVWPGNFIGSLRAYRHERSPGDADTWLSTVVALADEPTSALAQSAGLFDAANGLSVRARPEDVAFPNVELTATYLRSPHTAPPGADRLPTPQEDSASGWQGAATTVSFGPTGLGLTHTVWHDAFGPFAVTTQALTVRPNAD